MEIRQLNNTVSMYVDPIYRSLKQGQPFMALSIDKKSEKPHKGLIRVITKREGNVDIPGYNDRSKLIIVEGSDLFHWKKTKDLNIKGIDETVEKYAGDISSFIGLEDPDIWNDENGIKHVYFTMPFINEGIYLGHAQGNTLDSLISTDPVLSPLPEIGISYFKEVSISPIEKNGSRINLTEVGLSEGSNCFSAVASVVAHNMGKAWEYRDIVINPRKMPYEWCQGYVSPCTFFPKSFIDMKNLLVGLINGRERDKEVGGEKMYGKFRPGLILFNPKTGEVPWVSSEPLMEDPDATTITFASDFIQTAQSEGILFAHVNDSFVRAYKINAEGLKKIIEKS